MSKGNAWYRKLSRLARVVIAIIPFTAWIVHAIARITSGNLLSVVIGIICLFGVGLFVWIIDLVSVLIADKLLFC